MHLFLVCILFVGLAYAAPEKYTNKFDDVNLDEILNNKRLMKKYEDCLLADDSTKEQCPPEAKELKEHLAEALENGCSKCNEKQEEGAKKVILHLYKNDKPMYDRMAAKYDPDGKYMQKYKAEFEKQGIHV